ncbi:DUF7571 family protein, partial [Haloarcula hispanica]
RSETAVPDCCPACRSEHIDETGTDPGWHFDTMST